MVTQRKPPRRRSKRSGTEVRKRQHQVAVRLSADELALVQSAADRAGNSPASVLRDAFMASVKAPEGQSQ